jgi:hypothetical protein
VVGFYDCTCMLTGVSVDRVGATAVILQRTAAGYEPVTLGISGEYNGYGTIWSVNENRNTELVYDFFATQYRTGRFMAKDQTYDEDPELFTDEYGIEDLLSVIERTCSCWERYGNFYAPSTVLDGDVIVYAFIAQPIWDAVVERGSVETASAAPTREADFLRAFGDSTTAREIYDGHLPEVAEQVRQLAAISEFARKHELRWAPPGEEEQKYWKYSYVQHGSEDIFAFIANARLDYRDEPAILTALDTCANVAREWAG